jgi:hypothetical protein
MHDQYVKSPYDGTVASVFVYIYLYHKRVQFTYDNMYVLCTNKIHLQVIKNSTLSWNQYMTMTGTKCLSQYYRVKLHKKIYTNFLVQISADILSVTT